jgi:hypothetical protein
VEKVPEEVRLGLVKFLKIQLYNDFIEGRYQGHWRRRRRRRRSFPSSFFTT